jgi:hypothetical protein
MKSPTVARVPWKEGFRDDRGPQNGDCVPAKACFILIPFVLVALLWARTARAQQCLGDLDGDDAVTIDELVIAVNTALTGCPPPGPRFIDNGDRTVTDLDTGLQWEKKRNLDGRPVDGDPHDADNQYALCIGPTDCNDVDGGAFTDFLGALNRCEDDGSRPVTGVIGGFAGYCDWRLPTILELETIVDLSAPGCGTSFGGPPCIDPVFGDTGTGFEGYWSATPSSTFLTGAWYVNFAHGNTQPLQQRVTNYVRAVRTVH